MTDPAAPRLSTASLVRAATGLTYRQLNDWDAKGALPASTDRGHGWRRYTDREVFTIMICAEIRRRFGASLKLLARLRTEMLEASLDALDETLNQMISIGEGGWFVTDLDDYADIFPETRFELHIESVSFLNAPNGAVILLKLDPLVHRLLELLEPGLSIPRHQDGLNELRAYRRALSVRSEEELEILELIRTGEFSKILIRLSDGKVRTVNTEREYGEQQRHELMALLAEHDFQTLTLTKRDGKVVSVNQRLPRKSDSAR